jgi:hypothetical protein
MQVVCDAQSGADDQLRTTPGAQVQGNGTHLARRHVAAAMLTKMQKHVDII